MPFSEENQNYRSVAPWTLKTTVLMPTFLSKTTVLMPTFEKRAFIKGEMFVNNMAKRRGKRQRFTRQVRASIKDFLWGAEFAPMSEILDHVSADDTLEGLSRKERRSVAFTVMKAPVFHCFKTANSVRVGNSYSKKPRTLWKVNEDYEEFIPFKKD